MTITVFYGKQVYATYDNMKATWLDIEVIDAVYQEGLCFTRDKNGPKWFNCDGTPVLLEDVPKTLQMLALVLNL